MLDAGAGRTAGSEPAQSMFVGRASELELLRVALADAFSGRGRVVLLAGEPGIGKSRLVDELNAHAVARGALVSVGRCWEAGGAPAYWPWIQIVRAGLGATAGIRLRELLSRQFRQGLSVTGTPRPLQHRAFLIHHTDLDLALVDIHPDEACHATILLDRNASLSAA